MMKVYAEYGAIGVIVFLFIMMIVNLMKSQKLQNDDLDQIRQAIAKMESTIKNVESIVIKLIDRFNKSDENTANHRIDIVKELNDVTDLLSYLKGRINSKQ
jgi:septal ring factor EnvC (AmiA/AmiB activator)